MIDLTKDVVFAEIPKHLVVREGFHEFLQKFLFTHGFSWVNSGQSFQDASGRNVLIVNTRAECETDKRMVFSMWEVCDDTQYRLDSLRERSIELSYLHIENLISEMPNVGYFA